MIYEDFSYTFKWVDDGAYGYKNKETGEWNGLMGEILTQVGQKNKHVDFLSKMFVFGLAPCNIRF